MILRKMRFPPTQKRRGGTDIAGESRRCDGVSVPMRSANRKDMPRSQRASFRPEGNEGVASLLASRTFGNFRVPTGRQARRSRGVRTVLLIRWQYERRVRVMVARLEVPTALIADA